LPFKTELLKTPIVPGVVVKVKEKYNLKIPPPPGFTKSDVIAISEVRILLPAERATTPTAVAPVPTPLITTFGGGCITRTSISYSN